MTATIHDIADQRPHLMVVASDGVHEAQKVELCGYSSAGAIVRREKINPGRVRLFHVKHSRTCFT